MGAASQSESLFLGDTFPLKSYSGEKRHEHCGKCGDFSCDFLTQFSYDKGHDYDGKRIEQCKTWPLIKKH